MKDINIPKKIHYCWLGGKEKSDLVKQCIESWKKFAPDYEIIEWNENNFQLEDCNEYVNQAMSEKKWAFVTDYMRLVILNKYGGIYLDTDVELTKNMDVFLKNDSFLCMESLNTVCTAVIGAKKNTVWIDEIIDLYDKRSFIKKDGDLDLTPNSQYIYEFLRKKYFLKNNNKINNLNCNLRVYPAEYFSPKNYLTMKMNITNNTHAIHHYGGMWKSKASKFKDYILAFITRIIGENNREKLKNKIRNLK
ncbi:glycosyltransferase family 32 protein [Clostridium perfringens]|uniref:glycosyltransferase family 32 protein n=1 Tax=Clostridium perfringens TaxID=1502 RepID=UPI000D88A038|nr:glycosyltransferase [Clostridium perfringens]MDM0859159.1 glycosyltransferase [Clostridium perfringens]SQB38912.1 mannosyltransferase OCH1 [Clostridium perfringens]